MADQSVIMPQISDPLPVSLSAPTAESERIHTLDVLRGLALLGMLLVHFYDHSGAGAGWTAVLQWGIGVFASEKFYALFSVLFGVGFAVQLRRAEQRNTAFVAPYLRRIAVLFLFGFAAHALLGFHVLLGYTLVALPLLLVRRWSTRSLLALALVFTFGWALYSLAIGAYEWATLGSEGANRAYDARAAAVGASWSAVAAARAQDSYAVLLEARLRHMQWFYRQPWMLVPNELPLFVFGLVALRVGIFDAPRRHTRLIVAVMSLGFLAWAAHTWVLPQLPEFGPRGVVNPIRYSSRLGQWLTFTYAGGVLLLLTYRPRWGAFLAPFGSAGQMALTNYFLQILAIDPLISGYGVGLGELAPSLILPATLGFFATQAAFSRAWLTAYRFGPLEWIWRCLTYAEMQPIRRQRAAPNVAAAT